MFVRICLFLFLSWGLAIFDELHHYLVCHDIWIWAGFGVVIAQDLHCSPSFPTAVFHVSLFNGFWQDDHFCLHMESISFSPSLDVSLENGLLVKAVWYS